VGSSLLWGNYEVLKSEKVLVVWVASGLEQKAAAE
jgi:hypothetical protein